MPPFPVCIVRCIGIVCILILNMRLIFGGVEYTIHWFGVSLRARKLVNLRLFDDPATGKSWEKCARDLNLEILCVSQVSKSSL